MPSMKRISLIGAPLIAATLIALPARADFQSDWKDLIAAAQKEGKVVLSTVPGTGMRKKLPEIFKKKSYAGYIHKIRHICKTYFTINKNT